MIGARPCARRHVFRVRRNISEAGWVTVLNPVLPNGYPPQLLLTRSGDLTEPALPNEYGYTGPEYKMARARAPDGNGDYEVNDYVQSVPGRVVASVEDVRRAFQMKVKPNASRVKSKVQAP